MLSEKQLQVVISKINSSVNIPLLSESSEANIIDRFVDAINPQLEPSLGAILPAIYVQCIKLALKEGVPASERRKKISDILIAELGGPLSQQLNSRVDSSFVPDAVEAQLFTAVANKIIKEFVEWTVGELDEQLSASAMSDV